MRTTAALSVLFLIAGCDTPAESTYDIYDGPAFGQIGGQVVDLDGEPLADVSVTVQGVEVLTDADGMYLVDSMEPAEGIAVAFYKQGYAKGYSRADLISWETVNANSVLAEIDGTATFDAVTGGTIQVGEVTVQFPPGAIQYRDGASYDGTVTAEVTFIDPRTRELLAAPGDLRGVTLADQGAGKDLFDGNQLVSYGMVDVTLTDAGERDEETLDLKPGFAAEIDMPVEQDGLAATYLMEAGAEQQTWSFDPETMAWTEEGLGEVWEYVPEEDEEGEAGLYFNFTATHFSWWNCDQGMVPTCAAGKVIDTLNFPVRGAEVTCAGGASTSTATTDADGNYVCSVLAGDTVNFSGSTYVANRNWTASRGAYFMDGEGSSAATCEPIPDIKIEVCREAGIVMADNLTAHYSAEDSADVDQLRAWFWDPPGTVSECADPWSSIGMDTCTTMVPADTPSHYPDMGSDGMPDDTKSVGSWFQVTGGAQPYTLDRELVDGRPVYVWDQQSFTSSDGVVDESDITNEFVDFSGGDNLGATAPGDLSDNMGPISQNDLLTIPTDVELTGSNAGPVEVSAGQGLSFTMRSGSHPDGVMVFGIASKDDPALLCRFTDDGSVSIPGGSMSAMGATDYAGLGIYRTEVGWVAGPDGLPIRIQSFSGAVVPLTVK